jgi:exopolyphosphatase/guanosine-5'-triphosphate,3'-diphosphate pyrophosphatase
VIDPARRRVAAVDVGSTSVHLLVADLDEATGELEPILDASELLGLGTRVEGQGLLGREARAELATVLAGYAAEARRLGAERIVVVGTDPLRHAADAARTCWESESVSGVPTHVLEQDEEGALTLLGVTGGRPPARPLAVIDIGGGSTEIIVAGPEGIRRVVGLPLGASRLSTAIEVEDPPSPIELDALRSEARRIVARAPDLSFDDGVAVGGTAYGVARLATPPSATERIVDAAGLRVAAALISTEKANALAELFALNPRRARILPAGTAILEALVERYRIERITATEASIRDGLIRALIRDGDAWRDRLPSILASASGRARVEWPAGGDR